MMGGRDGPWSGPYVRYVEVCASRISDPVCRLRYLRRMMALRETGEWMRPSRRRLKQLAIVAALVLVPLGWRWTPVTSGFFGRARASSAHAGDSAGAAQEPAVWLVEQYPHYEIFSNGLRIERRFETAHRPRAYFLFDHEGSHPKASEVRQNPAGIVFHTTESTLAPFAQDHNERLRRLGMNLMEYSSANRLYHYVVDRFGRVYRVVREGDVANHSGFSVWADTRGIYVKLNQSFLGISIEGQSAGADEDASVNPAQIHSLKLLTRMLREKYDIPAENCITHAQVSVSPVSRSIGYHTDWAAQFPFEEIGLPNNYSQPLPSIVRFGFEHGEDFDAVADPVLMAALRRSEEQMAAAASAKGLSVESYRSRLRKDFGVFSEAMRQFTAAKETD